MNNLIELSLKRNRRGRITIQLRTDPSVEGYFEEVSGGSTTSPTDWGRSWDIPPSLLKENPGASPLRVYDLPNPGDRERSRAYSKKYTLWHPGGQLEVSPRNRREINNNDMLTNLSFLRLVGSGNGVLFNSNDMLTIEDLRAIGDKMVGSIQDFVEDYLNETKFDITVQRR